MFKRTLVLKSWKENTVKQLDSLLKDNESLKDSVKRYEKYWEESIVNYDLLYEENLKLKGFSSFRVWYGDNKYETVCAKSIIRGTENTAVFEGDNNEFIAEFRNVKSIIKI